MTLATIVFFASLALIVALFTLKFFEERRGARYGSRYRQLADNASLNLKDALVHSRTQIEKLPPKVAHHSLKGVVTGALGAAHMARKVESHAHRLADFVSAKRGFERRETKSEFLKGVSDYKNGGEAVDESQEV